MWRWGSIDLGEALLLWFGFSVVSKILKTYELHTVKDNNWNSSFEINPADKILDFDKEENKCEIQFQIGFVWLFDI